MDINRENALKLWDERYGKSTQKAEDFAGREMHKGLFGVAESDKGWNIDHRMPQSLGGSDSKCNMEIVNRVTNQEKGDKITFLANGKTFQVQKDSSAGSTCYKIVELQQKSNEPVDKSIDRMKLYKEHIHDGVDFAGRTVDEDQYGTDAETAWGIGLFVPSKGMTYANCFAASIQTIKDQNGKPLFKTNDETFVLIESSGTYRYVSETTVHDPFDYENVVAVAKRAFSSDATIYRDVVTFHVSGGQDDFNSKMSLLCQKIVAEMRQPESIVISRHQPNYLYHPQKMSIHFVFDTPQQEDVSEVHKIAIMLNTLAKIWQKKTEQGIEYGILHWLWDAPSSQYLSNISLLEERYQEQVRYSYTHNTLLVTTEVKNYLKKSGYIETSFNELTSQLHERNYVYTELSKLIDKKIK